jgi:hypothetical protein
VKGLAALLVVAAVCGPWLYLVQKRSPGWVDQSVSHDVVRRMAQPLEGHKGPPGYHLAAIWLFFLPWSLLLPLALALAWKRRHLPQLRFALGAVLGPWVLFEIVRTKLPHYMLPAYPWLALLAGDAVVRCLRGQHRDLDGRPFVVAVTVFAVIAGVAALAPAVASGWFGESVLPGAVVALAALMQAIVLKLHKLRRQNVTFRSYPRRLIDENRWRAGRYGLDGSLIDFGRKCEMNERDLIHEMLEFVMDEVDELGNQTELAHVEKILREGTGADRQLAVWEDTQDIKAVVDHIVRETYEGLPIQPALVSMAA